MLAIQKLLWYIITAFRTGLDFRPVLPQAVSRGEEGPGGKKLKILEEIIMKILKKTFGVCLIGLGIGILLVLFLPVLGWLFLIGVIVILVGILWLLC